MGDGAIRVRTVIIFISVYILKSQAIDEQIRPFKANSCHIFLLEVAKPSMKVLIVGANGKVGTLLCGKLWGAHDFSPVALIRDHRQQTKFTAIGVPSVVGDLEEGISQVSFRVGCSCFYCWFRS